MSATCLQENPPSYLHNNGYYKMNKNKTEYKYENFEEISANICFREDLFYNTAMAWDCF